MKPLALLIIAGTLLAQALAASAEPPHIGVLMFRPLTRAVQDQFRRGLRDRGYTDGQNVVIEWRSAEGKTERAARLAAELIRANVDVVVAEFTPAVQAAKAATPSTPIVMAPAGDPVASGLVASLARPGGNVTGVTDIGPELTGKRLELLRETLPGLTHVGLLINGADPLDKAFVERTRAAAAAANIQLHIGEAAGPAAMEHALAAMAQEHVGAVIVLGNVPVPAGQIAKAAERHRLPTISSLSLFAEAGGLMSYGVNSADILRRAARYVDRILKGARPADLPVEQPTTFELIINRKTARALGIAVPPAVLLRADHVIE